MSKVGLWLEQEVAYVPVTAQYSNPAHERRMQMEVVAKSCESHLE